MFESVYSLLLGSDVITTYLTIAVVLYTLCYLIEEVLGKYLSAPAEKKWVKVKVKSELHFTTRPTLIDYFYVYELTKVR